MPTGGELLVRALEDSGVEVVFGLPGVHNLPAWHALASSRIRLITVRHEQTAAYAADGYARATGRLGVALTTTGPGAANTLAAVGEAWASRSPIVVVATDIPTTIRRPGVYRGALHETTDQAAMFAPLTKAAFSAGDPAEVAEAVGEAVATATAAPARPVYLEIPTDVLAGSVTDRAGQGLPDPSVAVAGRAPVAAEPQPAAGDLDAALELIAAARTPLVWAGGGAVAAGAGPAVGALAERLCAPLITTYSARGLAGAGHPCAAGLPPHVPEVGALWDEADLVISVGSDLDGMMTQNWTMPRPPRLVAVNVDREDASKSYGADVVLEGDAQTTSEALAARVEPRAALDELSARLESLRAAAWRRLEDEHPEEVAFARAAAAALPPEAVVVCDMCIPGYWLAGFHPVSAPRRLAYPMGWGTLGFAFPAAIGAAAAGVGPVVSVSGDGGFLYACGELATVAQERLALTAVIVDDGGYGMLRFDQRQAGERPFGVDLTAPDFGALAASFGVESETVQGLGEEFGAALARHVALGRPSVLVAEARLEPPPTTSPRWYRRPSG